MISNIFYDCMHYIADFVKSHRKEFITSIVVIAFSLVLAMLIAFNEDALEFCSEWLVDKSIDELLDKDISIFGYFARQIIGFAILLIILVLLSIVMWESFLTYALLCLNTIVFCMNIGFMVAALGLAAILLVLLSVIFYICSSVLLCFACAICVNRAYCYSSFGCNGEGTFVNLFQKLLVVLVIYTVVCMLYCLLVAIFILPFCG